MRCRCDFRRSCIRLSGHRSSGGCERERKRGDGGSETEIFVRAEQCSALLFVVRTSGKLAIKYLSYIINTACLEYQESSVWLSSYLPPCRRAPVESSFPTWGHLCFPGRNSKYAWALHCVGSEKAKYIQAITRRILSNCGRMNFDARAAGRIKGERHQIIFVRRVRPSIRRSSFRVPGLVPQAQWIRCECEKPDA
jgi:hypothetical protein